ncbi:hypothetical protein PV703_11485 [Streptomyces sp. ME01-24h]|nr:hypothetical protein [Streptomyces sp. ME01-24h]
MAESLDPAVATLMAAIAPISDPIERYQAVKELEQLIDRNLKQAKADIANELHTDRSWNEVGKLLGVTGSRAEQISRGAR